MFQLSLSVHLPTGSDIVFDLDPLAHQIDPKQSSFRTLQPKIEIKLKKVDAGIKWNKVEGEDDTSATQKLSEYSLDSRPIDEIFYPPC